VSYQRMPVVVLCAVLCVLGLVGSAGANVTVSTTDGMTLTLTDTGAFSSLTVDGNTVPTLAGVSGGFFIVPMDGQSIDIARQTYYAGTQITGTATQSGSDIHLTASAVQNQTFDIWLRGGLPYVEIEATVTGNGSDHVFLLDFRLPVDANGWKWSNGTLPTQTQTVDTSSAYNWYFYPAYSYQGYHPAESSTPYSNLSAYNVSGVPNMGLSLSPTLIPAESFVMEYNKQTGFFIESELGTTSKTTVHPNTATFNCVLYKHNPQWGYRSAVQRYQSFFPEYFLRRVSGGNWFVVDPAKTQMPDDPITDFGFKFGEGETWTDSYWAANNVITCSYSEPWGLHTKYTDLATAYNNAADLPDNWGCAYTHDGCPTNTSRGYSVLEYAQSILNNSMENSDGTVLGPPSSPLWADEGFYVWPLNPDPDKGDTKHLSPGVTRAGLSEFREQYCSWTGAPHYDRPTAGQTYGGMYWDSVCAFGTGIGWDSTHNCRSEDWTTYTYNPGIYWGQWGNNPGGTLCMWGAFQNRKILDYTYQQMRRENRIVFVNSDGYASVLTLPYWDVLGKEGHIGACCLSLDHMLLQTLSRNRAVAGPKPVSLLCTADHLHSASEMNIALPFCNYPGMGMGGTIPKATFEASRSLYQQYMPIFDTLDAAIWHPITGAAPADSAQILERYGPDASAAIYLVLWTQNAGTGTVTCSNSDLGWTSDPNVTVTSLLGAAPSTSYSSGQLVLSYGSLAAGETRVTKIVYNGTVVTPRAGFSGSPTSGNASLAVTFTDSSVGTPTTWFWSFGDGSTATAQSPSHTYTAGGKYSVALTASNANGQDTMTKVDYITAAAVPGVAFSSYCTYGPPPLNSEFHDRSTNVPTAWSWSFGDGNTSTAQHPTHTYNAAGNYTVTLTATNAQGSSSPLAKSNLVTVKVISALFSANPTVGAPGMVVQFTDCSSGTPTSWSWTFGDGGTSTVQNPTHTYTSGGYYTVALTVANNLGNDSCTLTNFITVGSSVSYVYPTAYSFKDAETLVSGGVSNLQAQDQSYMAVAADTTFTYQGAHHSAYTTYYTANAGYSSSQILFMEVQFVAHCSSLTNYPGFNFWARRVAPAQGYPFNVGLGNGTWSPTDQVCTYTIRQSSIPTVVDDANGNTIGVSPCTCFTSGDANTNAAYSIYTDQIRWKIVTKPGQTPQAPIANFTGTPTSGGAPLAVTFTDTSSNVPTAWSWTFGDSSTSTLQNASHTYTAAGSYTVALKATNAQGNNTNTKTDYITVTSVTPPVANFSGTPTSGSAPLAVTFTDSSTNTPTSWSWNFGDSNTSTVQSPSHTYSSNGTFTVALTATNAGGSNTCTKTGYITVSTVVAPVANFSGAPTSGVAPLAVTFTDTSTNTPTSWSWTFGDSNTSTVQSPSHTYSSAGTYTVALTATNTAGNNTCTKSNYITVLQPGQVEVHLDSEQCTPTASSGSITDTYANDGVYQAFTITNHDPYYHFSSLGLYSYFVTSYTPSQVTKIRYEWTVKSSSNGDPNAWMGVWDKDGHINTTSSQSLTTSNTTFAWETTDAASFIRGDGSTPSNLCVCGTNSFTLYVDQARMILTLGTPVAPVADFTGTPTTGAAPLAVAFTDASTNTPTAWSWTFGDSNTSTVQNPSHTYSDAGSYTVALTATNAGGYDTCTKTNYITATQPSQVEIHLDSESSTPTASSGSITDTYTDDGVYQSFTITAGDPYYHFSSFGLFGYFVTTYTPSQISKIRIEWQVKSSSDGDPYAHMGVWDINGQVYNTSSQSLTTTDTTFVWETTNAASFVRWDGSVPSQMCLCGSNSYTFSVDQARMILTLVGGGTQPPVADFSVSPTAGNAPLAVSFTDASTNTPTSWSWDFGDSSTSTLQNPSHTYTTAGSYTAALIAANAGGSNTNTKTDCVTVLPPAPVADFIGNPTTGTYPLTVNFADTSSNTPTAWQWTFGDGSISTSQNPSHTYAYGTYTVSLIAANAGGSDTETKTNYIVATNTATAYLSSQDYSSWFPCTLISGALADTQTDDNVYRVIQCETTYYRYATYDWFSNSSYTPSQLVKIHVDYQVKSSVAGTPRLWILPYDINNGSRNDSLNPVVLDTMEANLSWETTDVPTFWRSDGTIPFRICGCPQIPSTTYAVSTDLAKVTLTLVDGGSPAPTANFSGTPTSGNVPLAVTFTDTSTGSPTAWNWDFGDLSGGYHVVSYAQNPSHTYTSAGTYTVTLTAVNAHGWNTMTKTNYITATSVPPPVANFSGNPTTGTAPLAVSFTDTSTNTPTTWSWDFGDSSTSTAQNPSHTYAAGTYTVSLTAANVGGSDGETKTDYITATVAAPTFVAAGSVASSYNAITPALPGGIATNDILLLFLETANQAISISNQNGGTWTEVTNSPQSVGSGSSATRITVFWSRYNGTQGAPTTSDSGDHQAGRIIAIRGATTSGDPWNVTAGGVEATADTSGSIPGGTTTVANCLVVGAIATSLPDANGTSNFSAWANADLTSVTERTDNTRNSGNGGGLGIATGVKATAGAYTTTGVTCGTATTKAMLSIANKP